MLQIFTNLKLIVFGILLLLLFIFSRPWLLCATDAVSLTIMAPEPPSSYPATATASAPSISRRHLFIQWEIPLWTSGRQALQNTPLLTTGWCNRRYACCIKIALFKYNIRGSVKMLVALLRKSFRWKAIFRKLCGNTSDIYLYRVM